MIKIKEYVKTLELDLSDLFLAVGFLFSIPFYAFSWLFMVTSDASTIVFKPWMFISCFVITFICWGIYFYYQVKKKRITNNIVTWLFVFFAVISVVNVLIQPKDFSINMVVRHVNAISESLYPGVEVGDVVTITATISDTHRAFFAMASLVITTVFYIVLVVLPKRIKSLNFVVLIGNIIFAFMFIQCLYSYITEFDKYIPYVKALLAGDEEGIYANAMCGFVVQRVPYGACMMLAIIFAIIVHGITHKCPYYLVILFFYINMIFSYCKTSIAITTVVIFLYIIFRLIRLYKTHKKISITLLSIIGGSILVVGGLFVISISSQGKYLSLFYKIFSSFTNNRTIKTRSYIWDNTFHLLQNGWWIIGRGLGTYNFMLYPMNLANGDDVCPSHSTYNAVLGAGGIFALLGFIALYFYYGYVFYKCFKVDKYRAIELSTGFFAYLIYSITEGVNYLILVSMFPLFVYYRLSKKDSDFSL